MGSIARVCSCILAKKKFMCGQKTAFLKTKILYMKTSNSCLKSFPSSVLIGLIIKFKDIFPGCARDCFIFDKLLFGMSRVIFIISEKITWS